MNYDEIKEIIEKDMKSCLIGFPITSERQKHIAERSYLIGELVRAKMDLRDKKEEIRQLRLKRL